MSPDALSVVLLGVDAPFNTSFAADTVARWPRGFLDALVKAGALRQAGYATSVECDGCEECCIGEVEFVPGEEGFPVRAYVVCNERDDIGRVPIALERLVQWSVDSGALAAWLSQQLAAAGGVDQIATGRLWWLGRATFRGGRLDVFLARGAGWDDAVQQIAGAARLQQCSRALVLTLGDCSPSLLPGKVVQSLVRLLTIADGQLVLDRQVIEDEVARRVGASAHQVIPFPTPPGTPWERVVILITADNDAAQVSAGKVTQPMTPAQMGLAYARNPSRPTVLWEFLVELSKEGSLKSGARFSAVVSKQVERLSRQFQVLFGIEGSPFKPYHKKRGYEPRFIIQRVDPRTR